MRARTHIHTQKFQRNITWVLNLASNRNETNAMTRQTRALQSVLRFNDS